MDLKARVDRLSWFHSINLGNGLVTPGRDKAVGRLADIGLPEDLTGKSVLDVGASDGFFSFEAERRGASRVLAVDRWEHYGDGPPESLLLAREALGSKVEWQRADVLELTPERVGTFDIVLFLGILYHVEHPLRTLETMRALTREKLLLETHLDFLFYRQPVMAVYPEYLTPNGNLAKWGPNVAAVTELLRRARFQDVRLHQMYPRLLGSSLLRRAVTAVYRKGANGWPFWHTIQVTRGVFHATPAFLP